MSGAGELYIRYAVSLAFAGLTVFLGYFARRTDFIPFIAAYAAFFGLYIWLIFRKQALTAARIRWFTGLGMLLRVLLLFSIPQFSDDFYRFLWDGRLTLAGYHPFMHPPSYYIDNHILPKGITPELFSKLNSPAYFTVYPPVCQFVFALAAWVSPVSEQGGVVAMKVFLLVCEAGTVWQLAVGSSSSSSGSRQWQGAGGSGSAGNPEVGRKQPCGRNALLYALNPLVITEIVGNCHFEGAMILFMVLGLRALESNKVRQAALWWSLATAAKLLPLMFLPIIGRWLGPHRGVRFLVIFTAASLVLFGPLLPVIPNIANSLDLYFRQFQFNASIYYLIGSIGFWIKGYDVGETLGPLLGLTAVAGVLAIAGKVGDPIPDPSPEGRGDVANSVESDVVLSTSPLPLGEGPGVGWKDALLLALMLQLSLSATVHPWYATVPLALGVLAGRRFPIWWSGLIALSYSHYNGGLFQENYLLIFLEYSVLWLVVLWEFKAAGFNLSRFRPRSNPPGSGTGR